MNDDNDVWLSRSLVAAVLASGQAHPEVLRLVNEWALQGDSVRFRKTSRDYILDLYQFRFAQPGFDASAVPGAATLLERLSLFAGPVLLMTVIRGSDNVAILWLDDSAENLVAAIAARNRETWEG